MKIVIIGSKGRLGAALSRIYTQQQHEVVGLAREQVDLRDPVALGKVLRGLDFDAVVNTAAMTSVDYCESHAADSYMVNAQSPREIAKVALEKGARFIHISTDYVFDGEKEGAYTEADAANPTGVYARSKREGEQEVLAVSSGHCVVRVSWVFGPDRGSFLDMIIRRALENERVEAVADKFSSPGYSLDYADWLGALLFAPAEQWSRSGGLLHLCNQGTTNWREYGEYGLQVAADAGLPLRTKTVEPVLLRDMKMFVAPRPVNTVMDTARFTEITGIVPRHWKGAVDHYVRNFVANDPELAKLGA